MTASSEFAHLRPGAQRLGLGALDIRRMVRTEQIPIVRDGRRVRIPAAWCDDPAAGWLKPPVDGL